ncbi:MAG: CopY/TcrY family copper transport repressor, partial [Lactococcus raffinolactis]|nr:CopY/TcrY family copper transport repressor [Lactococcus raffinolactis]
KGCFMETELNLSNGELVVMRVIWTTGKATANQISEQLSENFNWSISTIKTFLARLFEKKIVSREKVGREFAYMAQQDEASTVDYLTDDLAKKVCAMQHQRLIARLIETSDLTTSDLSKLSNLLTSKKPVEKVRCDCLKGACKC